MSKQESGHIKNAAQFNEIVEFTVSMGSNYNPSNPVLSTTILQSKRSDIKTVLEKIDMVESKQKDAIYIRQKLFGMLDHNASKIIFALRSSDVDEKIVNEAAGISKKILGSSKPKKKEAPPLEGNEVVFNSDAEPGEIVMTENENTAKVRSTSQRSYDKRLGNYSKLCSILAGITNYQPNEPELQLVNLLDLKTKIEDANTNVIQLSKSLSDARIARDELLYNGVNNVGEIVKKVKNYIKSIYGGNNDNSKLISKIKFVNFTK